MKFRSSAPAGPILARPEQLSPVPVELFKKVIGDQVSYSLPAATSICPISGNDTAGAFLRQQGVEASDPKPWQDGVSYLLDHCPFCKNSDHNATVSFTSRGLGFNCSHNSCQDKHWRDFREHYEAKEMAGLARCRRGDRAAGRGGSSER